MTRSHPFARLAVVFWALLVGLASPAFAERGDRLALVIGNAAYELSSWRLANPRRDAEAVADVLEQIGFEVTPVYDATRAELESAMADFGRRLRRAGPNAEAFVYYAGHGAQHEGVNLLIPVDADARTTDALRFQAPPLSFVLDDMAAAGNAVNIIVLDACRDLPLPSGSRSLGRGGLADVGDAPNVFIGYAARPGFTAADGAADHSPYTGALLDALASASHEPLSLVFEDISMAVTDATGGAQRPEFRNGLSVSRYSLTGERTAIRRPAMTTTTRPSKPPTPVPSRDEPAILGCWRWETNGLLIKPNRDGTINAGTDGTSWEAVGPREFQMNWVPITATSRLAADGHSLTAVDTFGKQSSAVRTDDGPAGFVGTWSWTDADGTATVHVEPDGSVRLDALRGRWDEEAEVYSVHWPITERVTVADDGQSLSGHSYFAGNPFGQITAKRASGCP